MSDQSFDIVETLAGAEIQHGRYNDRVYLMKLGEGEPAKVAKAVMAKAETEGYTKVFAKLPESAVEPFLDNGFRREALVPGLYNGNHAGAFLGAYLDPERKQGKEAGKLDQILDLALAKRGEALQAPTQLDPQFRLRKCTATDIPRMAEIYGQVFPTYPFPIHSPDYLLETMRTNVDYFGVETGNKLVALSSAEMDSEAGNVEMTDFATMPTWRGNGFGVALLRLMEQAMRQQTLPTAYTIARAASPGMNITFAKLGYDYAGRLVNNTNISGRIESMNTWYKPL